MKLELLPLIFQTSYLFNTYWLQREKYFGDKTRKELVKYALKHTKVTVYDIWTGNFDDTVTNSENDLPWLITFCGDGGGMLLSYYTYTTPLMIHA